MLKNMRVGTRLIMGFLSVSLLGAIVAGIGIWNMSKIDDLSDKMYARELLGLSYIKEANINLIYLGRARGNYLLATTNEEREKQRGSIKKYGDTLQGNLNKAKPLFVSERAKEIYANFDKTWEDYQKANEKVVSVGASEQLQHRSDELSQSMAEARKYANVLDDALTELSKRKEADALAASEESTALFESSRMLMIVLVLGSVVAGMMLGILITRNLTGQLGGEPSDAVAIAGRIAAGDLSGAIETRSNDRSSLMFALKTMRDSLVNIVGQVRAGTETIATASSQIATGNLDLSSRTEQQASSLEETASSMEELTSTVKQNADNARQANGLAVSASEVALKGGAVVSQVVDTMGSINDSAKKIVDIIGVIDGIAFQTNILALNAAVEAARAGEQGRGFAVVASEVRNLAQRSAAAAKEIKALIGDSVEKVDAGAKLVNQAGVTMNEIVESVQRVTDIMSEIAAASREQTSGIEQINQSISQMDHVTQQNAALVEEAAAAAESLQDQSSNLSQVVSVFRLDGVHASVVLPLKAASHPAALAKPIAAARPTTTVKSRRAAINMKPRVANAPAAAESDWEQY
ncbi:MAG: methyl-accepting chemotaxis protein [Telluria sp.]